MATAHIESREEEIAKTVIMPGDPLRAKMIAETYLTEVKLVNTVRNILGYTGYYKGKRVTVFSSGMGIPSACIYAYELYQFYGVEEIIRVGSCGSTKENIRLLDVILATEAYSLSSFPKLFNGCTDTKIAASTELNQKIQLVAEKKGMVLHSGTILTSDVFDVYVDHEAYMKNYPKDFNALGVEMEAFGLFYLARLFNKKAACLLTVVDSHYDKREISSEARQKSLNPMIEIALDTCL